jgi:hypothetical protein
MGRPTDHEAVPGQDEREIRALVDRMFDSWGRGDAAAYHADFTDDADYVSFDGSRRGKADSIASHENLFRTVLYGSRSGRVNPLHHPRRGRGASDRLGSGGLAAADAPATAVPPDPGGRAARRALAGHRLPQHPGAAPVDQRSHGEAGRSGRPLAHQPGSAQAALSTGAESIHGR